MDSKIVGAGRKSFDRLTSQGELDAWTGRVAISGALGGAFPLALPADFVFVDLMFRLAR